MPDRQLTPEQKQSVIHVRFSQSVSDLAKRYGCDRSQIESVLGAYAARGAHHPTRAQPSPGRKRMPGIYLKGSTPFAAKPVAGKP